MIVNLRKDCPHVLKHNLMKLEDFNKIAFGNLKCEKCEEKKNYGFACIVENPFVPDI